MRAVRDWSVRNAGALEAVYNVTFSLVRGFDPLWRRIGLARLERPTAAAEASLKGFLFDCYPIYICFLGHRVLEVGEGSVLVFLAYPASYFRNGTWSYGRDVRINLGT